MSFRTLERHPIPFDQRLIDEVWAEAPGKNAGDSPHVDEAHEEYLKTIAEHGEWHVFRVTYPFGFGSTIYIWNSAFGEGVCIDDFEGEWHEIVNLFAAIVEAEGDCRDAECSSSLMPSGTYRQRCQECGDSWSI